MSPVVWVLCGVVVVALVVGGYVIYQRSVQEQVETEQIKSVAVLPFVDMSPENDQAYLGDGIADAIINALNNVEELRVIDRTSSFQFRGKEDAIDEIGEKLTVDAVLEGSVHKHEKRLRIMAQLIKVSDHSHFFSETYDIDFGDIFAIQDSISLLVLKELKFILMGEEKAAVAKRYTIDPDAYESFLHGIHSIGEKDANPEAHEYFLEAVEKDPNSPLFHTLIAYTYFWCYADLEKAKEHIDRALDLDNTLPAAHNIKANIALFGDWDFSTARKEIDTAIKLNPDFSEAHLMKSLYQEIFGELPEALKEIKKAQKFNPLYITNHAVAMWQNIKAGDFENASAQFNTARELLPTSTLMYYPLAVLYTTQGRYDEAIKALSEVDENNPWGYEIDGYLGYIYALKGEREKAQQKLNYFQENPNTQSHSLSMIAMIYTGLRENDLAFEYLEKAYEKREEKLLFIKSDVEFAPLRSDPRFKTLLRKIGLPED